MNRIALLIMALIFVTGVSAAVFRWVDENGEVHYSDVPENDDAVMVLITSNPTDPDAIAAQRENAVAVEIEREKRAQQEQTAKAEQKQEQKQDNDVRAQNCQKAKDIYDSYYNAPRLYKPTEDGGREYLSGPEMDQLRAKANADVEKWCN